MATLNTNARYLHDNLSTHAEMLADTMPGKLKVESISVYVTIYDALQSFIV